MKLKDFLEEYVEKGVIVVVYTLEYNADEDIDEISAAYHYFYNGLESLEDYKSWTTMRERYVEKCHPKNRQQLWIRVI